MHYNCAVVKDKQQLNLRPSSGKGAYNVAVVFKLGSPQVCLTQNCCHRHSTKEHTETFTSAKLMCKMVVFFFF